MTSTELSTIVRQLTTRISLSGVALVAALLLAVPAAGDATVLRPFRFPDIHQDFVVFSYAGDLWRVATSGGTARRLTAHPGLELFPKISRDGRWVAFSAEISGARQVWVMPSEGGTPRQLTFYTDVGAMPPRGGWDYWLQDWTPDGKVLVRCNRTPWGERMGTYCLVDPAGGLETTLPLPHGGSASLSPDGTKLAYTPVDREFRTWKRTRGGRAQDLWIFDLAAMRSQRLTDDPGTDNFPMWAGDQIVFTSDRNGTLNLFSLPAGGGDVRQLTRFDEYDVLWPALGPGAIVFQNGGQLWRFDLASEQSEPIDIAIDSELPETVPHFIDVSAQIGGASLSPSGKRVLFDARGELFSVPKEKGPTRQLTRTAGVRERDAAWSPDGQQVAYLSDESGEYELYVRPADDPAAARRLTHEGGPWPANPAWSPDGKRIAWNDRGRRLRVIDVASGTIQEIATGHLGDLDRYTWSPDSQWLAYELPHPSELAGIAVFSLAEGRSQLLGDGLTNDSEPEWSADGKALFFLSQRDYELRFSEYEFNYVYDRSLRIYAATLDPASPPLFPPESDEETGRDEQGEAKDEAKSDRGEKKEKKEKRDDEPVVGRVVAEGFVARTVALPGIEPGGYRSLRAVDGALFFLAREEQGFALRRYDLAKRKAETVLSGVAAYDLTPDGSKALVRVGDKWSVVDATAGQTAGDGTLDLAGLTVKLDPLTDWQQLFEDAWRITRDFFYDPAMHGVDWETMRERYGRLVPGLGRRGELDFLLGEMMGELEAGHTYVGAGDEPAVERVEGGKLGAELELDAESGRYRVARIFAGEGWDEAFRSPLTAPGVDVAVGSYLLAIDSEELRYPDNPYRLLENKADQQVALTVAASAAGERRSVTVRTIAGEGNLRYIDWVKSRMALVDRLSGGQVGYIHLPDTAVDGNRMLQKLFISQFRKPALIVDDRYNGGGFIPDRMIEMLARQTLSWWARRDIESFRTPGFAHDGPKAMLINGYSSSGGDALPYYFRKENLGTLIGTRTWGGLIGISGAPQLADGGQVLPPTFRIYDERGRWVVENEGVAPDIEVYDLPEALAAGGDPSIEKAVEVLLDELRERPVAEPTAPTAPDMASDDDVSP